MADLVYSFNHFPEITVAMHKEIASIVRETAKDIQGWAKNDVPYDTGFLQSSIYVKDSEGSDYGQTGPPPGDSYLLPEVEAPPDDMTAYVAVGANYGIYQEMGTRFMPPHPYFYQAVETARSDFEEKLSTLEARIGAGI